MRGRESGTCCSDSFPIKLCVIYARFCEEVMFRGKSLVPTTFCMKFKWLESVELEGGKIKMTSIFKAATCALLLQTVPATTQFYASISFLCTSSRTIPTTRVQCVHAKGLVPEAHPQNCADFKGAQSRFAHIEKFSLNFSNSSFVIRFNLFHP